jgi:hypothetical protein
MGVMGEDSWMGCEMVEILVTIHNLAAHLVFPDVQNALLLVQCVPFGKDLNAEGSGLS